MYCADMLTIKNYLIYELYILVYVSYNVESQ